MGIVVRSITPLKLWKKQIERTRSNLVSCHFTQMGGRGETGAARVFLFVFSGLHGILLINCAPKPLAGRI
jgi:hypothetical protein